VWFLQESHGVTSQKTPFFIVTAVKTSNLTQDIMFKDNGKVCHGCVTMRQICGCHSMPFCWRNDSGSSLFATASDGQWLISVMLAVINVSFL
jgi:hypothetical protein